MLSKNTRAIWFLSNILTLKISISNNFFCSSVGNDILGFDSNGKTVNESATHGSKTIDWEGICRLSSKVLTFIDLAGHEKYLKTTVFGMTGHCPDFCMLMVCNFYFYWPKFNKFAQKVLQVFVLQIKS